MLRLSPEAKAAGYTIKRLRRSVCPSGGYDVRMDGVRVSRTYQTREEAINDANRRLCRVCIKSSRCAIHTSASNPVLTLREAIKQFPALLDELVMSVHNEAPFSLTDWAVFQFIGDSDYRTGHQVRRKCASSVLKRT